VGYDYDTSPAAAAPRLTDAVFGFRRLTLVPPFGIDGVTLTFNASTAISGSIDVNPQDGTIAKTGGTFVPMDGMNYSYEFLSPVTVPVYDWVTHTFDIAGFTNATKWDDLNVPATSYGGGVVGNKLVRCLLPGSELACEGPDDASVIQPGFYAQGGIFFEPSVPRASLDLLGSNHARVVDADHSLNDPSAVADDWEREIGMRESPDYTVFGTGPTPNFADTVNFEVRRVRRFHDSAVAGNSMLPLQYAYEIRRGRITQYNTDDKQVATVVADAFVMDWNTANPAAPHAADVWNDGGVYSGTNLGSFNNEDVNIHPGDTFRLLDSSGDLVEAVEIIFVGDNYLKLAPPGITALTPTAGMRFEVWLKQAPVPHEQSNEQLLALITDRVVLTSNPDWGAATEKGGYVASGVYAAAKNKLSDSLLADGSTAQMTFGGLGVRVGDIVIVDPVGTIPRKSGLPLVQEQGVRPLGDNAVSARASFAAGRPSLLDDNRGFYRVTTVANTVLGVDEETTFTGSASSPVIFDSTDATRAYAVYPTISDSMLSGTTEGQMDLRPTAVRNAGTGSFSNSGTSIQPFAYKIIRPSGLFTAETIDLVLATRERILSLIELIRQGAVEKYGTYFTFQRDTHIASLTGTDVAGYLSNAYLTSLVGNVQTVPFANNTGCLSILDRRFWILDKRLDSLTYDTGIGMQPTPPGTPYTQFETTSGGRVRPVLPDLIDVSLNSSDRFRSLRYAWLTYRVHRTRGTLANIVRFDQQLPEKLAEQKRLILQELSLESV
jgi:hypothetical protein